MSRQPGVVIGVVQNVLDPLGEGRVQLSFPWMPGEPTSMWAPIASPLSGSDRGLWFMPEVGDEALVAFEQGDFDHPFVVGFLWNGVDTPPDDDVHHRVLVTPGQHELRFEDNEGNTQIVLTSSGGHELRLSDRPGELRVTLTTNGGHSIELDDTTQSITVQTNGMQKLHLADTPVPSVELSGGGRTVRIANGAIQIT